MYTAVSAIGVKKGINKRWEEIPLLDYSVKELFEQFRKVYVTVLVLPDQTPAYLDLEEVASRYSDYTKKLNDMFIDNKNVAFAVSDSKPVVEVKTAKFKDAYAARYSVTPIHPLHGTNASEQNRTAALLTRDYPAVNYDLFYERCMVSVNGLYHMIDTNGQDGVVVYDAMTSLRKCRQNQMGILSFYDVCEITYVPILPDMIHKRMTQDMIDGLKPQEPYSSSGYIKINQDLTGKTVFLVLGGYLNASDSDLVTRVSDNEFKIDFENYPLLDRFFESNQYIDLSSLGLSTDIRNKSQISIDELLSDEVLLAYMTLSQSFFVILDAPEVFVNKHYIKKTGMPGMFIAYNRPIYPIVTGMGRHPEYWHTFEDGQWSLTIYDNTAHQRVYNTTIDPKTLMSAARSNTPTDPEILSGAYFMEIGTDLKKD